ncbi:hypothetical protein ACHAW6_000057 [Cyclotella cf. meneghiniana]
MVIVHYWCPTNI